MQRIGLAASKIANGNIWTYHLSVILISLLFALFIFLICGFCIALTIFLLSLLLEHVLPAVNSESWWKVLKICLKLLGILISISTLVAILQNVKLKLKI